MMRNYRTAGVCARIIGVDVDGDTVKDVVMRGGCRGQSVALPRLVRGMKVDDVISRLKGTPCRKFGGETTSCADQLARILELEKSETSKKDIVIQ